MTNVAISVLPMCVCDTMDLSLREYSLFGDQSVGEERIYRAWELPSNPCSPVNLSNSCNCSTAAALLVMSAFHLLLALLSILTSCISASPSYNSRPFVSFLARRQAPSNTSTAALEVDLGYERYRGVADSSTGLNTFKGIRFAAPPTGSRRWQPPTIPQVNRDRLIPADALPERCPQSYMSPAPPGFNYTGSEDCLFLSVYAPPESQNLPVLVFIHGGGYGLGQGSQDLSMIINANNQSFIGVAIRKLVWALLSLISRLALALPLAS